MDVHGLRIRAQLEPASINTEALLVKEHLYSTQAWYSLCVLRGGSLPKKASISIEAGSSCALVLQL